MRAAAVTLCEHSGILSCRKKSTSFFTIHSFYSHPFAHQRNNCLSFSHTQMHCETKQRKINAHTKMIMRMALQNRVQVLNAVEILTHTSHYFLVRLENHSILRLFCWIFENSVLWAFPSFSISYVREVCMRGFFCVLSLSRKSTFQLQHLFIMLTLLYVL